MDKRVFASLFTSMKCSENVQKMLIESEIQRRLSFEKSISKDVNVVKIYMVNFNVTTFNNGVFINQ